MNKLPLDLEELQVDSFDTTGNARTERAFAWSDDSVCPTVGPSRLCP